MQLRNRQYVHIKTPTYSATYRMWFRLPVPKTNLNPNPNPDPDPNPRTRPNPNPIFSRNRNKVFERKQKQQKNNTQKYRSIYSYISRLILQGRGEGTEGPVSPTAKREPADYRNVRYAIY